ncbi:MAG TPA: hypothetical protein VN200_01580 [Rhodoglobus sp.]|nr:hypothetical protein [Rhodoglobus sp.]
MTRRASLLRRLPVALAAAGVALALLALPTIAPPRAATAEQFLDAYAERNSQTLRVPAEAGVLAAARDGFGATPGVDSLVAEGTNHAWAKLVMLLGGWPMSESNVTVFTRWMRQENGPDDWWNRNNPLNNGWGSGGGGGLGSYDSLVTAAENAAEALHGNPGYADIVAGFATSAPTAEIEQAIWASPWATSHYHYGGHWSSAPVPVVSAPPEAWG